MTKREAYLSFKCWHCEYLENESGECLYGKTESLNISERKNLADCMISNSKGLWALLHCGYCGYVDVIYPIRINGEECTPEECEKLMEEITKYDKAGEQND